MGVLLCKANKTSGREYFYKSSPTMTEKETQLNRREKLYQQIEELFENVNINNVYKSNDEQQKELEAFHNQHKNEVTTKSESQFFLYHISKKSLKQKENNNELRNLKEIQYLAEGSYGQVILVQNPRKKKFVVKKIPLINLAKQDEQNLLDEINILNELKHPNIIKYLSHKYDQEYLMIYLEYMELGSIGEILENLGPIPEPLVAHFVNQILEGLEFIHSKNIVHRDLKGDNILVGIDGSVKIGDFGSACYQNEQQKKDVGTLAWMAPELLQFQNWNNKVDIWSLGCLVFEMLTGKSPFQLQNKNKITNNIIEFNNQFHFLNGKQFQIATIDFIKCCLQKNPKQRLSVDKLKNHPFCNIAIPINKAFDNLAETQMQDLEIKKTQNKSFDSLRSYQFINFLSIFKFVFQLLQFQ